MEVLLKCNLYFCGYLWHVDQKICINNLKNVKFSTPLKYYNTYFSPVSSLPKKWMTTVLKTKLENTVNNPAIPGRQKRISYADTNEAKHSSNYQKYSRLRMYKQ